MNFERHIFSPIVHGNKHSAVNSTKAGIGEPCSQPSESPTQVTDGFRNQGSGEQHGKKRAGVFPTETSDHREHSSNLELLGMGYVRGCTLQPRT